MQGSTLARVTLLRNLAGDAIVFHHEQVVAGARDAVETLHLDRTGRASILDILAVLVDHAAHAAVGRTDDDGIADVERTALDDDGGHRTAAAVEVRLDGGTLGVHVRVSGQLEGRVGRQDDSLQQVVEVGPLLGGDIDEHGVAAVLLRHEAVLGQLATDLVRLCVRLIDLVDRHDDRNVRSLGVVNRLNGLRHNAVVCGHHEDGQVRRLRTAGTHGGERLVARGIEEGDGALATLDLDIDLVSADALGNATGLLATIVGVADRVQKAGLAVVDVPHDGDDRRALGEVFLGAFVFAELQIEVLEQLAVLVFWGDDFHGVVNLRTEELQRLLRDRCGGRHHLAQVEQSLDQRCRIRTDLLGEVGQGGTTTEADSFAAAVRQPNATNDVRRLHCLVLVPLLPLRLLRLARRAARPTECAGGTAAPAAATPETTRRATTTWAAAVAATATAASAALVGGLRRHRGRVRVRRHHSRRRTTATAGLRCRLVLPLTRLSCARLSTRLGARLRTRLALAAVAAGNARTRRRPVPTTGGERVVGYAASAARLRHRARHRVARGRALAALAIACTRLASTRLGSARLRRTWLWRPRLCGTRLRSARLGSPRLRRSGLFCTRLRGAWLGSSRLRSGRLLRARLRGARLGCSGLRGARLGCTRLGGGGLGVLLAGGWLRLAGCSCIGVGVGAAVLLLVDGAHLLHHRRFDGGGRRLDELTLLFQGSK